eukprot:12611085-Ditylum_brightwellii.AAC.1
MKKKNLRVHLKLEVIQKKHQIEKPKIHQANKEDSATNGSSYYGPTLHEEEISSSFCSYSGSKLNSSDIEIVMKPSTWKEKEMKKKIDNDDESA